MFPGRIQDPEVVRHLLISYQTAAVAIASINRHRFPLINYKDALTCRLKVVEKMTTRDLRNPAEGSKKLLIYSANTHPRSILHPVEGTDSVKPRFR